MAYRLEARLTATASVLGGHVDAAADRYITAGDYYVKTAAPGGSVGLLAEWAARLSQDVASTTVTLNSNGTILVTWGSGSHSYTFASTVFRDLLGFTGNIASAPTATGTKKCQLIWLPGNYLPSAMRGSVAARGSMHHDRSFRRAQSGKHYVSLYNTYREETFVWRGIPKSILLLEDEPSLDNSSLERLWESYLAGGSPFRVYTDATSDSSYLTPSGARRDYVLKNPSFEPKRLNERHDTSWEIRLECNYAA